MIFTFTNKQKTLDINISEYKNKFICFYSLHDILEEHFSKQTVILTFNKITNKHKRILNTLINEKSLFLKSKLLKNQLYIYVNL